MVQVKPALSNIKTDPLRNFKFQVEIHAVSGGKRLFGTFGFMSVQGLTMSTEVIPYREGGMNTTTLKLPGQSDFSPITLSTGLQIGNSSMADWMKTLFSVQAASGNDGLMGADFRANVYIRALDHPVTTTTDVPAKAVWKVYNAWPTSLSFSDLDAGANAIIVNQMVLAHEGWEFALAKGAGASSVDIA